jgi:hypothetical protein
MHTASVLQNLGQISTSALSGAATGLAEADEAKAATTVRTIAEKNALFVSRLIQDLMILLEDNRTMGLLLCAENFYLKFILGSCAPKQPRISAMSTDCQSRPFSNLVRNYHLASVSEPFSICFCREYDIFLQTLQTMYSSGIHRSNKNYTMFS